MPAPKLLNRWGLALKLEGTADTYNAPDPAADAVLAPTRVDVKTDWAHTGERGHSSLASLGRSGRFHTFSIDHEPAPAGAAYNGTTHVASILSLLRMCGCGVTVDTTPGAEKETYAPTAVDTYATLSGLIATRGQLYTAAGGIGEFTLQCDIGDVPKLTVAVSAISDALPSEGAFPAFVYAGSQAADPVKAAGLQITFDAFTPARVKTMKLTQSRGINARTMDNTTPGNGRHGGFAPGGDPTYKLEVLVEAEPFANYDPYAVAEAASRAAFSATFGAAGTYKRHVLASAQAELTEVPEQDENNVAAWNLTYMLRASSFLGNDYFTWTFTK